MGCETTNRATPVDIAAAFFNRGLVYRGKSQRAIQDYSQALALRPNYPDALNERGLAYRRSGQTDQALQDYDQALRLKADFFDALNSRCYLKAIVGQLLAALQGNEALRLDPRNKYAFDSRGFAYLKLGMLDAAIADYNIALQIEPGRPYSLFGRGVARRKRGDTAGGNTDMAAAKAKVPGIADEFAKYGVRVD